MNRTSIIIISPILIGVMLFLSGCRTAGKKSASDWSIPSLKLSRASKDDVKPPSEHASADATARLAHERMDGHNPTATFSPSDDPSLQPNPTEIAQLHRIEGSNVPEWASGSDLPPEPEATAPEPAQRVAQNVSDSTMNAAAQAAAQNAVVQNADSSSNVYNGELPDSLEEIPVQTASGVPAAVPPPGYNVPAGIPSNGNTSVAAHLPNGLNGSNGTVTPGASGMGGAAVAATSAGSTMTELPGTLPSGTGTGTGTGTAVQTSAAVPGTQPAAAQPAVLFMPGSINPQYPNLPATNR